jgi:dihydrofolate reductase
MRLIKYFVASSLDNFISRKDGSVDWLFTDQDYGMFEFFSTVDVAVMGRRTYEKMVELRPNNPFFPRMQHYVFSHTMQSTLHKQVEIVSGDPRGWADRIRRQAGKDIWLVGGGDLVRDFFQKKLINELGIAIHPRLLGEGIPLFAQPYPEAELVLLRSKQYPNGLLQVFYRVKSLQSSR